LNNSARQQPLPARLSTEGIIITVRLTPKASVDEVQGVEDMTEGPVLKARVRAIPDKGKANDAVAKLLADWLGEPKSHATLVSGGKSRLKQVLIRGDANLLMAKFATRIASFLS